MKKKIIILIALIIAITSYILLKTTPLNEKEKELDSPLAFTYNGEETSTSYATFVSGLGSSYKVSVTCENGSVGTIDSDGNLNFTTTNMPDYCTINFEDNP